MKAFLLFLSEEAIGQGKGQVFVKFNDRLLGRLRGQFGIELLAAGRIQKFDARLGQITRGFIQPGPEDLSERIARLVLERQFLLPPPHQFAAMLLDELVTRVGARIEAKALVKIRRFVFAPAVPLVWIVRKWNRKDSLELHHVTPPRWRPIRPSRVRFRPARDRCFVRWSPWPGSRMH